MISYILYYFFIQQQKNKNNSLNFLFIIIIREFVIYFYFGLSKNIVVEIRIIPTTAFEIYESYKIKYNKIVEVFKSVI